MSDSTDNQTQPVMDAEHLSAMTGADAALAIEVIDIFRQQTDIWLRMLDAASPQQQWTDAAHSLKGSALSVGAKRLAAACAVLEQKGRSESIIGTTEAATMISGVKDEIGPAIEASARLAHQLSLSGRFKLS